MITIADKYHRERGGRGQRKGERWAETDRNKQTGRQRQTDRRVGVGERESGEQTERERERESGRYSYGKVPEGLLTFLGFFLCNGEFSPCWALPEYIRALIHLA